MRRAATAQRGRSSSPFRATLREPRARRWRARRCAVGAEPLEGRALPSLTVPLGPLQFVGDFTQDGNTYAINSGTAELGLQPTGSEPFTPLVSIDGALQVTTGTGEFTFSGAWDAVIVPGAPIALWQAATTTTVSVAALTQTGQPLGSGGQGIAVAGATFTPDEIVLAQAAGSATGPQVQLQGGLTVPALPGLTLPVDGAHFVPLGSKGIESFTADLSQGFGLFGFHLDVPGGEALTVGFVPSEMPSEEGFFEVSGDIRAPELFDASVRLGSAGQPGLVIKDGEFQLDHFLLSLGHVDLGAFVIDDLTLAFSQGGNISGTLLMWLPEAEATVGGEITLDNGKVDDISLDYSDAEGIPLGDTGLFLTQISAKVLNIADPSNLIVSGSIGVNFLDSFPIGTHAYSVFRAEGSFTVSRSELILSGAVGFFVDTEDANPDGQVSGLLGQGSATMTLDWAAKTYSIDATASMYDDTFEFTAGFSFNAGRTLVIDASADVKVPHGVPFIGGKTIGGLHFAFDYEKATSPGESPEGTGYAAAWLELDILHHRFDVGFKYDLDKHLSIIGAPPADAGAVTLATNGTDHAYSIPFNVPAGASQGVLGVDFGAPAGSHQYVTITPLGGTPIDEKDFEANGFKLLDRDEIRAPAGESSLRVGVVALAGESLSSEYTLTFHSDAPLDQTPTSSSTFSYPAPTVHVGAPALEFSPYQYIRIPIEATVAAGLANQTTISVYADRDADGHDGVLIATVPFQQGNLFVDWVPTSSGPSADDYYFYAVLNDGPGSPVYSDHSGPQFVFSELSGTVRDQQGVPLPGVTLSVYVNNDPTPALTTVTSASGQYGFVNLPTVIINAPSATRFRLVLTAPPHVTIAFPPNPVLEFEYPGSPVHQDFTLLLPSSATGTVTDAAGGKGVPGATVYADLNHDGRYNPGEPTAVTGLRGDYRLIGLPEDATVTLGLLPPTGYRTNAPDTLTFTTSHDPHQLVTGKDFRLTRLADITGVVRDDSGKARAGWTVSLYDFSVPVVAEMSAQTDVNGTYHFYVEPGALYLVQEQVPSGYRQIAPFAGVFSSSASRLDLGGQPLALAAGNFADFFGSNHLDLVAASYHFDTSTGNVPTIFLGNGDGQFLVKEPLAPLNPIDVVIDLATVDSERLGGLGLVAVGARGEVVFFTPAGQPRQIATLPGLDAFRNVAVADFDRDGNDDIAYSYGGSVAVLLSTNGYQPAVFDVGFGGNVAAGDMNGDGYPDLVVNSASGGRRDGFSIYYNNKNSTNPFSGPPAFIPFNLQNVSNGGNLALADLNRDGRMDVLVSDISSAQTVGLYYAIQQGPGQFEGFEPTGVQFLSGTAITSMIVRDFNGDLMPDWAFTAYNLGGFGNGLYLLVNRGHDGSYFQDQSAVSLDLGPGAEPTDMVAGDFNQDGLLDLAVTDARTNGGIHVVLNSTAQNHGTLVALPTKGGPLLLAPFVNAVVSQLGGQVYDDANGNGVKEPGEAGLSGVTVYLDLDNNGRLDPGEPRTVTSAAGVYGFDGLAGGTYAVRTVLDPDRKATGPAPTLTVGGAQQSVVANLGTAARLLRPVAEVQAVEGQTIALPIGTTSAAQGRRLRFALGPNAPQGMALDPQTGLITWAPSESQGPGISLITVSAQDLDQPTIHETLTFRINVSEVNSPPVVTPSANQSVSAGERLAFIVRASDPDVPAQRLSFALAPGAPAGAAIDAATGRFTWAPLANTPPGPYRITVLVSDDGSPRQVGAAALTINVLPAAADVRFVHDAFVSLLGRLPTPQERSSWLAQLRAGVPAADLARGLAVTTDHRGVAVDRLTSALLHRPPGPEAHARLVTLLSRRGPGAVIGRLAASRRYAATHRGASAFVQGLYADLLTRAPDRAELSGWLGAAARLGAGRAQLARAFARAPEVQARIAELFDPLSVLGNSPEI